MTETTVPTKVEREVETPTIREESRFLVPPVDIFETAERLTVVADMPGVEKGDAEVRVDNGLLTLEGRPRHGAEGRPLLNEFTLMPYYRQFELGEAFDPDKITAELTHGVLTVHLPKPEKEKPRQIAVQVG